MTFRISAAGNRKAAQNAATILSSNWKKVVSGTEHAYIFFSCGVCRTVDLIIIGLFWRYKKNGNQDH